MVVNKEFRDDRRLKSFLTVSHVLFQITSHNIENIHAIKTLLIEVLDNNI